MRKELFVIAAKSLKDVLAMRDRVARLTQSSDVVTTTITAATVDRINDMLEKQNVIIYIPLSRYRVTGYSVLPHQGTPEIDFHLSQMLKYKSSEFLCGCPVTPGGFNVLRSRWTASHSTVFPG